MAQVHLVSPVDDFGPWDWRNPDDPGIGGSETMHCEIAWRLAARGHTVHAYAPLRDDTPRFHRGVTWHPLADVPLMGPGLIVLIRGMYLLDALMPRDDQIIWTVQQDANWPPQWPKDWAPSVTRVIALCEQQARHLRAEHPAFAEKVCQSRNGLRGDLVDQVLAEPPRPRHHKRIFFASSPDRGLLPLLHAFRLIRLHHPDAELWVAYGFDNLDKVPPTSRARWERERLERALDQPGVIRLGRVAQPELYRRWTECGLMMAPTNFAETGHITLLEAQALGAIPIVNPRWATGEYQLEGIAIDGNPEVDRLTLARYAMAAVYLMDHLEIQNEVRPAMMAESRKRFDWEGVVDQYEAWMLEDGVLS